MWQRIMEWLDHSYVPWIVLVYGLIVYGCVKLSRNIHVIRPPPSDE